MPSRINWNDSPPKKLGRPNPETSQPAPREEGQIPGPPPAYTHPPTPLLDALGRDLTTLARKGKLSPLFGRRAELRRLQRILLRKSKNNPLIVGAPGVGKTTLVEGLAGLIAGEALPAEVQVLRIVEITPAQLTAGTGVRGSFEARMQLILDEARRDPALVLFIDEIHTLLRAGAAEGGALDAANILKPALSRGEIRCIGATTPDEFDHFIHSDPAFERRFDPLILDEPSIAEVVEILTAAQPGLEAHHHLHILPEAIQASIRLSIRHILDRSLPDKALDLLDSACALARLPEEEEGPEKPVKEIVGAREVAAALATRLGVRPEDFNADTHARLASLEAGLAAVIFGQPVALNRIAAAIRSAAAGLGDPSRPRHVFAFFGSTGTGKTAAALSLAEFLFGSPDAAIRLDMSEYKEPHTVARLWGAPPGYVGYQDEGSFASRLRRQPFSVVLLDEFEKAHPQVLDAFLQIFDSGRFTDTRGRVVDARQAYFILTSNLFSLEELDSAESHDLHAETIRQSLVPLLRPELINRIDSIVLFQTLSIASLAEIAAAEIRSLNARLSTHRLTIQAAPQVLQWIAGRASDPASGARAVQRLVAKCAAEPVSAGLSEGRIQPGQVYELTIQSGEIVLRKEDGASLALTS